MKKWRAREPLPNRQTEEIDHELIADPPKRHQPTIERGSTRVQKCCFLNRLLCSTDFKSALKEENQKKNLQRKNLKGIFCKG
jgi:hypothetical protein